MNRKERRTAAKRDNRLAAPAHSLGQPDAASMAELMAMARQLYQQGRYAQAHDICDQILAREPAHVQSLNLLGVIAQGAGRHNAAIKFIAKAVAADKLNAACHYNLASSYQALDRRDEAAAHFKTAIALGMSDKNIEEFIIQAPAVAGYLEKRGTAWPLPAKSDVESGALDFGAVAHDIFLRCALEATAVRGAELEFFLTDIRSALLRLAASAVGERAVGDDIAGFACAFAQQCYINEYIFAQSDEETRRAGELRELLLQNLTAAREIPPLLLAAVATYWPLHSLPAAERLLTLDWPEFVVGLLRQQLREPLEEACDRDEIPALTTVEDGVSLQVMQQYEENPYPRWTVNPLAVLAGDRSMQADADAHAGQDKEILIAGCGTGQHAFQIAQTFPAARVLAVDISGSSLAYARRKTREEGLRNVEYAQADILKLATISRSFDRIECVGVLHHLGDPKAGWRVLLSLLRPDGEMRIGLYSQAARRAVVQARALIAERGYRATPEDIRKCRQEIFRNKDDRRWKMLIAGADFYNMSGCRDLLFNVMEQRFTIPEIKSFLDEQSLSFLGFELDPPAIEKFQRQFPGQAALTDLNCWHAYETANPDTFRHMYVFSVRKGAQP